MALAQFKSALAVTITVLQFLKDNRMDGEDVKIAKKVVGQVLGRLLCNLEELAI